MMQEHRIVLVIPHGYTISSPEEMDIVQSILPELGAWEIENSMYESPSFALVCKAGPIGTPIRAKDSIVNKRDNKCDLLRRGKSDASNLVCASLNIESNVGGAGEMLFIEGLQISEGFGNVDPRFGTAYLWKGAFALGFGQVHDGYGAEGPIP